MKLRISGVARRLLLLLAAGILMSSGVAAQSNTITVVVPGTAAPWSCSGVNAGYIYGGCGSASPVVVSAANGLSFQPGDSLTVTYVSGMASQYGACPVAYCYDANGFGVWNDMLDPGLGYLPSKYIPPAEYPVGVMTLVGAFTDSSGSIVGAPQRLGDGPTTLVIPTGATQFQMGVNDDNYGDNNGSFTVQVSGTSSIKLTLTLDPCGDPCTVGPSAFSGILPHPSVVNLLAQVKPSSGQNYQVQFLVTSLNQSAPGHAHNSPPPPTGDIDDLSTNPPTATSTCVTSPDPVDPAVGSCELSYVAPEIVGKFKIVASIVTMPNVSDSKNVAVAIPDVLGALSASPGVFTLTGCGAPCGQSTTSFPACAGTLIQHPSNHFATAQFLVKVQQLATIYHQATNDRLGLNDMSLPFGGLFDICDNWTNPHSLHRYGNSVDIDHTATLKPMQLQNIAEQRLGLTQIQEGPIHYELIQ
jgi:hypothetical protein